MFTGLVEEVGRIAAVQNGAASARLSIEGRVVMHGLRRGDSVAVNGVCLTACTVAGNRFSADVMHETLNRSTLGGLRAGSPVNLERAMAADGRFGGHIVSGHVDGVGTVKSIAQDGVAWRYTVQAAPALLRYVIEKGSIAIDGISLTVAAVGADWFQVSIIPHTSANTTLSGLRTGDAVNLETDVIGRYVERLLGMGSLSENNADPQPANMGVTLDFLTRSGF